MEMKEGGNSHPSFPISSHVSGRDFDSIFPRLIVETIRFIS
ncbi:hypothetical protein CP97_14719 [Aurantiacibacter atlanticus]|uniref:Uncharacterized protein n=1 Tax=Aurantiacibacter atlanticus TaxID=1648404 RepID=A0A168M1D7_9SPHN|nr:hypothetical protein CP97_14719 [Aurantiacibacter atlanticus]